MNKIFVPISKAELLYIELKLNGMLETERLVVKDLRKEDAEFIFYLVNSPDWIRFIGDRNIKNVEEAVNYVGKIIDNPNITYWVIFLKESENPVGIISFVKRDYLEHHDIGFALLPEYAGNGYASEATQAVINYLITQKQWPAILAITVKGNQRSIQLLEKAGLKFDKIIKNENEELLVYSMQLI